METTLTVLFHVCTPDKHPTCLEQEALELTSVRPPVDVPLRIEYYPPRWSLEGDGPTFIVPVADLANWPSVISSHLDS